MLAVGLQVLNSLQILATALLLLILALGFARERSLRLLLRTRWLFVSLLVLFLFFTPGEYLSGPWGAAGMTREGMLRAISQIGLLVAMLSSLSLLHEWLGTSGVLAGLYCLIPPVAGREKTMVRLMLVLAWAESRRKEGWRENWREWMSLADAVDDAPPLERVSLALRPLCVHDWCVMALGVGSVLYWMV